jgi:hypothetical protein
MRVVKATALLALLFVGGMGLGHIQRDAASQATFPAPRALDTPVVTMPIPNTPKEIARYPRTEKPSPSQSASSPGTSAGDADASTAIAPLTQIVPPLPPPPAAASGDRPHGITIR